MWKIRGIGFVAAVCFTLGASSAGAVEYECGADFNGDGVSNEVDASILHDAFGTREGDADYLAAADLNGDGTVGVGDWNLFQSCPE